MSVKQANFTIIFDGEALRGSRMDVRDLAPALLALGDLLEQANRVLNGDKASISVHVKAFEAGCFGISLEMLQSYAKEIWSSFFSKDNTLYNALEILALLGLNPVTIGGGLFYLIKRMKGCKPKSTKTLSDGNVTIVFTNDLGVDDDVTVKKEVALLFSDKSVRSAAHNTVTPLLREGIDSFSYKDGDEIIPLVSANEAQYFILPILEPTEIPIDNSPQERILSIVALSFKEDNKWRLSDGGSIFNVTMSDSTFVSQVSQGLRDFAKGDMLRVLLATKVYYTHDGLRTDYEAVTVLEQIKAPRQGLLPLDEGSHD